jgi:PAS domain-containing protein
VASRGVVITFAGISEMQAAEREIEAARAYLNSIIATIRQPRVVLDEQLRIITASSSFHRTFSVKPEELVGRHLLAAADHLDVPALHDFLDSIQARGTTMALKAMKAGAVDFIEKPVGHQDRSRASDVRSIRRATQQRCPNCGKPRRQALQV